MLKQVKRMHEVSKGLKVKAVIMWLGGGLYTVKKSKLTVSKYYRITSELLIFTVLCAGRALKCGVLLLKAPQVHGVVCSHCLTAFCRMSSNQSHGSLPLVTGYR